MIMSSTCNLINNVTYTKTNNSTLNCIIFAASVEVVVLEAGGTEVTFQPPWNDPEYVINIPEEQDVGTVITVVRTAA